MKGKAFNESKDLIIGPSRNGEGIFTKRLFDKGEKIFQVTGIFITRQQDSNVDAETKSNSYRYSFSI